uniref:Uncharacterized protein n=1 Tax=Magallana gigas TaxID=29159 RepID=K1PIZ7_MAGGI
MPLDPVTQARDIYRKEKAKKRRLQTDTTAGEKLEHTLVVSRDQEVVLQEEEAIIITGRLWGKFSTKTDEEYRP